MNDSNYQGPESAVARFREVNRRRHGFWLPLMIIGMGVVFLLGQFQLVEVDRAFDFFWPVVLIIAGAEGILNCRSGRFPLLGVGLIAVGAALALRSLGYLPFEVENLWPVILIAVGVGMLQRRGRILHGEFRWQASEARAQAALDKPPEGGGASGAGDGWEADFDCIAFLGGVKRRVTRRDFSGGRLTALFGGFEIDLTRAEIAGAEAVIDANAMFGGGEIRVPEHWVIDIQGQAILGGYADETHQRPPETGAKRLIVKGTATFGGVVIKN